MPEIKKIIETLSPASSTVLVINELGSVGSHLVDVLLGLGCQIYYLGNKKEDYLDHLWNKNNFEFLKQFNKVQELSNLSYIFYLGDKKRKYLSPITKICRDKKIKLLFSFQGTPQSAEEIIKELTSQGIDNRVCIFKEIFGPRIRKGLVASIIESAFLGKKIKIPSGEDSGTKLVYSSDFVKGITRAMFAPDTLGKLIDLSGNDLSFLTLISELEKKSKKNLETEFLKETLTPNLLEKEYKKNLDFDWKPEVTLAEGVAEVIVWLEREKESHFHKSQKNMILVFPLVFRSAKIRKLIFGMSVFFFLSSILFLIPILVFLGKMFYAKKSFLRAEKAWTEGELVKTKTELTKAINQIDSSRQIFDLSSPFYEVFGLGTGVKQVDNLLTIESKTLDTLESFFQIADIFLPSFSSLLKGEKIDLRARTSEINIYLDKIYANTSYLLVTLENNQIEENILKTFGVEKYLVLEKAVLPVLRKEIFRAKMVLPSLPEILGDPEEKTYLVLFQNNLELRPTGGLISSYGLLTFEKGRLINFEIKDVDSEEDQFKGEIDPPSKIREYLGENRWLMRDGNWDPDFITAAQRLEWFIDKQTGREIDGVVGFNLGALREIIELTGDLTIPDDDEKITAYNLYERAEYSSKTFSTETSGQKNDLFGKMMGSFFERSKKYTNREIISFLTAVYQSLNRKEILVYLHQPDAAEYLQMFNWDGAIQSSNICQKITGNCLFDYLSINEANLGGNRANFFIKRIINHGVTINEQGQVSEDLKIYYQNNSPIEVWPAGRYRVYLRFYLPSGSQLESLMINDPSEPGLWVQMPNDQIDFISEHGKAVIGYLLEVPVKSARIIEIKYLLTERINLVKPFSYTLLTQKQSGSGETGYKFMLNFPVEVNPLRILPKGELSSGKILIDDQLTTDRIFRVDFGR